MKILPLPERAFIDLEISFSQACWSIQRICPNISSMALHGSLLLGARQLPDRADGRRGYSRADRISGSSADGEPIAAGDRTDRSETCAIRRYCGRPSG